MNISCGIAETVNIRQNMEDRHAIQIDESKGFFSAGVYDGHAGASAAAIAAELLTPTFLSLYDSTKGTRAFEEWFNAEQVRHAYVTTDKAIVNRTIEGGAAVATLYFHEDRFIAANVGDVRIVLGDGFKAVQITLDHKPDLPEEKSRIEALGGEIINYDVPRLQGTLAMARALGDTYLKPYVTAEPRVTEGFLGRKTDIAVLASDGIWDVLTSKEAISIARSAGSAQGGAELVQVKALERGSRDNITVIVLDLKAYTSSFSRRRLRIRVVTDFA